MKVVCLSGGVGGAKLARGLHDVLGPGELTVIGNVGDDVEVLGLHVSPDLDSTFKDAKERWVSTFERDYILSLLKKNKGNISHAAREADIDRKYFRKLMRKYGIEGGGDDDDKDDADTAS